MKLLVPVLVFWGRRRSMSPIPAHSDRDDPVADNLCMAVAFSVSIASENCFHMQVTVIVSLGLLWSLVLGFGAGVIRVAPRCKRFVASVSAALADLVVSPTLCCKSIRSSAFL